MISARGIARTFLVGAAALMLSTSVLATANIPAPAGWKYEKSHFSAWQQVAAIPVEATDGSGRKGVAQYRGVSPLISDLNATKI